MDVDVLSSRVERLAALATPADRIEVLELSRLAGGLSRQTWRMRVQVANGHGEPATEQLVLQLLPRSGLLDSDLAAEFDLLTALADTAIPVPVPRWVDPDGEVLGMPGLVTGYVEGRSDPYVLAGDSALERRLAAAQEFMRLLTSLAGVDAAALTRETRFLDPGPEAALVALKEWRRRFESVRVEAAPELALVHDWLRSNAPTTPRRVLVHGDFKPGNVLMHEGRVVALLDWETAHLGSPLEDLGWVTNPVRRTEHQIPGHWERPQMVEAFTHATGIEVPEPELRWWNVFSCYKLAVIVHAGVHGYLNGDMPHLHHSPTWLYRAMFKMIRAGGLDQESGAL